MPQLTPFAHYPFMTVVPGRRVEQKVHKTLGQAKSAIVNSIGIHRDDAAIYKYDGATEIGEAWIELYRITPGTPKDQMPWVEQTLRLFTAEQHIRSHRTIRVMARNQQEAAAKYRDGEWDATEWVEDGDSRIWGWTDRG